jgi:hypothetical protein
MSRRDFFRFIVLGGLLGYISKKLRIRIKPRKAMFWRKVA